MHKLMSQPPSTATTECHTQHEPIYVQMCDADLDLTFHCIL